MAAIMGNGGIIMKIMSNQMANDDDDDDIGDVAPSWK